MHIPNHLQNHTEQPALLIALSAHEGVVWSIQDNQASERARFRTENPVYSDREGHFKTASGGSTLRSGAVYEDTKHEVLHEHLVAAEKTIQPLLNETQWHVAWLFVPARITGEVKKRLKQLFRKVPNVQIIKGNVTQEAPLDLLQRIGEHNKGRRTPQMATPVSEEADKLMHTTDDLPGR